MKKEIKLTYKEKKLSVMEKAKAIQQKGLIIVEQGYKCAVCGKYFDNSNIPEIAHRISKSKNNYKKYGYEVINHRMNLRATCSGNCNDAVSINPATRPLEAQDLVNNIMIELAKEMKSAN